MINRNNYEEYFLLLADNELPPAEAASVKQFAALHPDLQEELDILMSCRLDTEPMPVFPKEKLLRTTTWDAENPAPVQTRLLLLLDNELPAAEKQELQHQIATSTTLQAEWATLQQAKLVAEAIAHPDKESLHRNERKIRPLVWMRWAAAAMLAGIAFLWWQNNGHPGENNQELVVASPQKETSPAATRQAINQTQQTTQPAATATTSVAKDDIAAATAPPPTPAITQQKKNTAKRQSKEDITTAADNALESTTLPIEAEPVTTTLHYTTAALEPAAHSEHTATLTAHLSPKTIALPAAVMQKNEAFTGSTATGAEDSEGSLTIGGVRIQKQKMRGLLRNVTRSVARTFSKSKLEPEGYATRN